MIMENNVLFRDLTNKEKMDGFSYLFMYCNTKAFFTRQATLEDGEIVKFHTRISDNPNDNLWYKMNSKVVKFVGIGKMIVGSGKMEDSQKMKVVALDIKERIVNTDSLTPTISCINCGQIIFDDKTDLCPSCLSFYDYHSVHSSNVMKLLPHHEKEDFMKNADKIDNPKLLMLKLPLDD